MSHYQLAQLNIAIMKEPLESPGMAGFVANLDRINALAEIWRGRSSSIEAAAVSA